MRNLGTCLLVMLFCISCIRSLERDDEKRYDKWTERGYLLRKRSPAIGAVTGLLPGGGSFYNGYWGKGVVNAGFWPLSMAWDIPNGKKGAIRRNYEATREKLKAQTLLELKELDRGLAEKTITAEGYMSKQREIEKKYLISASEVLVNESDQDSK